MSILNLLGIPTKNIGAKVKQRKIPKRAKPEPAKSKIKPGTVPAGRVSSPNVADRFDLNHLKEKTKIIKASYNFEVIPVIRALYKSNEDVGSVVNDLVQLTNTGHMIKFDQSVNPKLADEMREHLKIRGEEWGFGTPGMNGLINKFITQIWVGGAISVESPPDSRLTKIDNIALVNPETIRFSMDNKGHYQPLQKLSYFNGLKNEYIKLNPKTYFYLGLIGDEDTPYGIPPFMTALYALSTQKDMRINISHILNQLGLLGYLEVNVEKPDQAGNENDLKYGNRLVNLLKETKENVIGGFKEGVVTGFKEDHEFEFHATTKNLAGVPDIFNMNEIMVANGLKTHPSFLNVSSGNTDGNMSIVFTKMLSQLKNVQEILSYVIKKIYTLELTLAGYNFKGLSIEFKPSTITDDLKLWQAKEIKQRVLHSLWIDRIISSELYAESMDYQKPHKIIEPPLPGEEAGTDQKKKEDREKDKDKSDRKVRDKNKPQPKRRDRETKER